MIIYSDNTAGNTLYKYYGGWSVFLNDASKYSQNTDYLSISQYDNYINAQYLNDTLNYLYSNSNKFEGLLMDLKNATVNEYLDYTRIEEPIAQKYGSYDEYLHATGIVYTQKPYFITILTKNLYNAEKIIGEINEISYNFLK